MATAAELNALSNEQDFRANMFFAVATVIKEIYADPREDTADPPYDQSGPNPDERQVLARDVLFGRGFATWIGLYSQAVLARNTATPIATLQGFGLPEWTQECRLTTDELAEALTDLP